MNNVLLKIAQVQHLMKEDAADQLEAVADKQQDLIVLKKNARKAQEAFDHMMSDEVVEPGELENLEAMMQAYGMIDGSLNLDLTATSGSNYETGVDNDADSDEQADRRTNAAAFEGVNTMIENYTEGLEDSESDLQLKIQLASGALQNAEQLESKAVKLDTDSEKNVLQNIG